MFGQSSTPCNYRQGSWVHDPSAVAPYRLEREFDANRFVKGWKYAYRSFWGLCDLGLPRNESRPYENVLYPASALAARTLEDGLADRGFRVKRVDSYTTEPAAWTADDAARAAAVAVVAIGSPSAARVWAERVGTGQAAACIGETSARACEDLGFSSVFFPDKPGIPGWAASVRDAVASLGAE